MSKILMRRTELWRVNTEAEAEEIIKEAQADGGDLTKKTIELKQRKAKGIVVEENKKVTVQVDYEGQWDVEVAGGE